MGCLSADLLIWIVEVIALVMIIRLVVPWVTSFFALPALVVQIITIIIWALIAIWGILILFSLFSCMGVGGHFSLLPR